MQPNRSPSNQKSFFCDRFNITLKFHPNGGITGTLFPFRSLAKIACELTGLYCIFNNKKSVYLACDFTDPNLTTKTEISFAGEIITYDSDHDCLIIRWLMSQEVLGTKILDRDMDVLLDDTYGDDRVETAKIKEYLTKNALDFMSKASVLR